MIRQPTIMAYGRHQPSRLVSRLINRLIVSGRT